MGRIGYKRDSVLLFLINLGRNKQWRTEGGAGGRGAIRPGPRTNRGLETQHFLGAGGQKVLPPLFIRVGGKGIEWATQPGILRKI